MIESAALLSRGTVQVHLNRRCNLRCAHCYSSSGPEHEEVLDAETVLGFLADARELGYQVASFSGGEPLLHPELPRILAGAAELGLTSTLVTNGTLLTEGRLERTKDWVDVFAVSLEGPAPVHDEVRGRSAFRRLQEGVALLQARRRAFGFVHTIGPSSLEVLPWLVQFAGSSGARLLQLHPLEQVGWAEVNALEACSPLELARVCVAAEVMDRLTCSRLQIRVDLLHRDEVLSDPGRLYARIDEHWELPNPLVLEVSGRVVPLCHGFHPSYALGTLGTNRLRVLARAYRGSSRHAGLARLGRLAAERMQALKGPFFNGYDLLRRLSNAVPLSPRRLPSAEHVGLGPLEAHGEG